MQPTFSPDEHDAPLAPVTWKAASALVVDTNRRVIEMLRDEMRMRCSGDLDWSTSADDALDMIGAASRPFDMILLATDDMLFGQAIHVAELLRRQRSPSVVFAYSAGEPPTTISWPWFVGIADWLDIAKPRHWPRRVQQSLDGGATMRRILTRAQVPWHIDTAIAHRIYGAGPGDSFKAPPAT